MLWFFTLHVAWLLLIEWSLHSYSDLQQHFESFSVLISWTVRTKRSIRIWKKHIGSLKTQSASLHNDNFVSRRLQRTNRKTGEIITVCHRELLKKRSRVCTLFSQLVVQGLKFARQLHYKICRSCALCQECGLDGRRWLIWDDHQTSNFWHSFPLDQGV